ncbi:hypothetical protein EDB86DRAFT_2810977, partial [Lactarius hatsudake]
GLDLRDVELVVQWRHTKSLCMLWQRLGCAARDPSTEATGIYIVEPKFMDCHMQTKQKVGTSTSVHVRGRKAGPSSRKQPHLQPEHDQSEPDSGAPQTTGRLIVQEE